MDLNIGEEKVYEWKKRRLDCEEHKGFLWQHTAHISDHSYFSGKEGKFLTTIGGCHYPQSPYPWVVEFDLVTLTRSNSCKLKSGLVSHDSLANGNEIMIFGGATGGDFNPNRISLLKGQITYQNGHNAVGCCSFQD